MTKTYLPDINFWLALVFDAHVHHPSAKAWIDALSDEGCSFCRVTQQGFLRLTNNPKVFAADAVTLSGAWQLYDTLLSDPRVAFASEPSQLEAIWRTLTKGSLYTPNSWTDAYLAAFAQAGDYELLTFDRGFAQYRNVAVNILP